VLAAVGVLVVGGLVAGIVASTMSYGGITQGGAVAGNAIGFGAGWAEPLLAMALLGVVGVCWWQFEAWSDASEPDDGLDRVVEVTGHIGRAKRISQWTQAELLLLCAGAVALVVGIVLQSIGVGSNADAVDWARIVIEVASLLAVLVVAGAGAWIGRKITLDQESLG
jgi:hypothetical protein